MRHEKLMLINGKGDCLEIGKGDCLETIYRLMLETINLLPLHSPKLTRTVQTTINIVLSCIVSDVGL
jgi:hypothetical protein